MKANFDSDVETDILEGEEKSGQKTKSEGSRTQADSSSCSSHSHSHQIAFSSEIPFSKTREVW